MFLKKIGKRKSEFQIKRKKIEIETKNIFLKNFTKDIVLISQVQIFDGNFLLYFFFDLPCIKQNYYIQEYLCLSQ